MFKQFSPDFFMQMFRQSRSYCEEHVFLGLICFIYTDSSHLVIRTHSYVVPGIIKIFSENDFRAAGMLRGKVFYAVD